MWNPFKKQPKEEPKEQLYTVLVLYMISDNETQSCTIQNVNSLKRNDLGITLYCEDDRSMFFSIDKLIYVDAQAQKSKK